MNHRTDRGEFPPPKHIVEVWYHTTWLLAVWDGQAWHPIDNARQTLPGIISWKERTR